MGLREVWKYDLPRLLRWRPSPFEAVLAAGVLGFLAVVGTIFWSMLPTSSMGRYGSSVASMRMTAEHFPRSRDGLPEGSRFYRAMHGEKMVLYTPATPETIGALLERWPLKMQGREEVLRAMEAYAAMVAPEGTDLEREGAVWGRVIASPGRGSVWFDPSTGEIIYFAREEGER
ncbi:MAG: hypothetical protein Tsb0013_10080 [Phycisphaerales bacterium]